MQQTAHRKDRDIEIDSAYQRAMQPYRSILIYAPLDTDLSRMITTARHLSSDASITVVDVLEPLDKTIKKSLLESLGKDPESEIVATRTVQLESQRNADAKIVVSVNFGNIAEELITRVANDKHDLVLKIVDRNDGTLGSLDMRLLRHCPSDVCVLRQRRQESFNSILACVDLATEDPLKRDLNKKVAERACLLAEEATVTALYAWYMEGEYLYKAFSMLSEHNGFKGERFPEILDSQATIEQSAMHAFIRSLASEYPELKSETIHGDTETVVLSYAKANGIDLVVLGSVGRSGLHGFFIGNTAEKILQRVTTSLLVVKPDSFKTRVKVG